MFEGMRSGDVRAMLMRAAIDALALDTDFLEKAFRHFEVRKMLGNEGRIHALRRLGATIGDQVFVSPLVTIRNPAHLTIGDGTRLGGAAWIDSWWPITFGKDVLVNGDVAFLSAEHDVDSPTFEAAGGPLTIGDFAWLPHRIVVLPGAHIGAYAVVGTGSVVTREVAPYAVVAGNPARLIGERARQNYTYRPSAL